jgi:hypothetical protein
MAKAICISCGSRKNKLYHKCGGCGFDPTADDQSLVKSMYLSTGRFVTGEETEEEYESQKTYSIELDDIAEQIKNGRSVEYDQNELTRLQEQLSLVRSIPFTTVRGAVVRIFLPAFVLLGVLLLIISILRCCR